MRANWLVWTSSPAPGLGYWSAKLTHMYQTKSILMKIWQNMDEADKRLISSHKKEGSARQGLADEDIVST